MPEKFNGVNQLVDALVRELTSVGVSEVRNVGGGEVDADGFPIAHVDLSSLPVDHPKLPEVMRQYSLVMPPQLIISVSFSNSRYERMAIKACRELGGVENGVGNSKFFYFARK